MSCPFSFAVPLSSLSPSLFPAVFSNCLAQVASCQPLPFPLLLPPRTLFLSPSFSFPFLSISLLCAYVSFVRLLFCLPWVCLCLLSPVVLAICGGWSFGSGSLPVVQFGVGSFRFVCVVLLCMVWLSLWCCVCRGVFIAGRLCCFWRRPLPWEVRFQWCLILFFGGLGVGFLFLGCCVVACLAGGYC